MGQSVIISIAEDNVANHVGRARSTGAATIGSAV